LEIAENPQRIALRYENWHKEGPFCLLRSSIDPLKDSFSDFPNSFIRGLLGNSKQRIHVRDGIEYLIKDDAFFDRASAHHPLAYIPCFF
jgi:hypothetical protein